MAVTTRRVVAVRWADVSQASRLCKAAYKVAASLAKGGRPFATDDARIWHSLRSAAAFYGIDQACIRRVLKGRGKTAGGRVFAYLEAA